MKHVVMLLLVVLVRTAAAQVQWTQAQQLPFTVRAIGPANATDVYVAGSFSGTIVLGGSSLTSYGTTDLVLARYTQQGTLVWARQVGGAGASVQANAIENLGGNLGLVIVGDFAGTLTQGASLSGTANRSMLIMRFDAAGNVQWARKVSSADGSCTANDVLTGSFYGDGCAIVAGTIGGTTVDFSTQQVPVGIAARACLARFSLLNGNTLAVEPISSGSLSYGEAVRSDLTGVVSFMARITGNLTIGTPAQQVTANRPAVLVATFERTAGQLSQAKVLATGLIILKGQPGTPGTVEGRAFDVDYIYSTKYIVGNFAGKVSLGSLAIDVGPTPHAFVLCADINLNVKWARDLGLADASTSYAVYSYLLTSWGATDKLLTVAYPRRYPNATQPLLSYTRLRLLGLTTANGTERWSTEAGGSGSSQPVGLTYRSSTSLDGRFYVVGSYTGTLTLGGLGLPAPAAGVRANRFMAQFQIIPPAARSSAGAAAFSVFPNPTHDVLHLQLPPAAGPVRHAQLLDLYGHPVRALAVTPLTPTSLSVAGLPPGRYLLRLDTATSSYSQMVEVE